jgi:anti-sigma-K factor RskA
MTCDERRDLILQYAADALDEGQENELRAHLAGGCPRCHGALAEAETVLAQIPLSMDPVTPPPRARQRLMDRVSGQSSRGSASGWRMFAIAASIGLLVGALAIHFAESSQHDKILRDVLAKVEDRDQKLGELNSMLQSEKMKFVQFNAALEQSAASGRILWDQDKNRWHVFVFDLKPPPGRTWELWFIKPDQTKIAAATFDTDANGFASKIVPVPPDIGPIALAAITDEPVGVPHVQPTGSIHLVGKLQ